MLWAPHIAEKDKDVSKGLFGNNDKLLSYEFAVKNKGKIMKCCHIVFHISILIFKVNLWNSDNLLLLSNTPKGTRSISQSFSDDRKIVNT